MKQPTLVKLASPTITCLLISGTALANTTATTPQTGQSQETLVVTAARQTDPLTNLISPVIEITKDDIEKTQANTLTEVLRKLPGVQISSNGGYTGVTRVYVHGSNNVLVLFNGARIGSATSGFTDFSQIPLAGVEKVEYFRGAKASVYGADAGDGVINIITKGANTQTKGVVSVRGGSDGYQEYNANVALIPTEKSWLNISTQYQRSDGYDISNFASHDHDSDGFDSRNIIIDTGVEFSNQWVAQLSGFYHNTESEYDTDLTWGPSNDENETDNYGFVAKTAYAGERLSSTLLTSFSKEESTSKHNTPSSSIETQRYNINWRNNYQITEVNTVGFAFEHLNDDVGDSDTKYDESERYNNASYITASHNGDVLQVEGSVRYDDNEQFGDKTTWQFGTGWQISEPIRLTTNVGTGFKVPTFNDLYWPNFGNPDLDPEESTNYEVAVEGVHALFNWRLAGFYKDIDDRISCQSTYSTCLNDSLEIKGVELTSGFDTGIIRHQVSLEYLEPKDKATGKQAIRVARQNFKWQASYQGDAWQANLSYLYQGKRRDAGDSHLGSYSLVDIAASYDITPAVNVGARIDNLLDKDYELANNYNTAERSYYATVAYQF